MHALYVHTYVCTVLPDMIHTYLLSASLTYACMYIRMLSAVCLKPISFSTYTDIRITKQTSSSTLRAINHLRTYISNNNEQTYIHRYRLPTGSHCMLTSTMNKVDRHTYVHYLILTFEGFDSYHLVLQSQFVCYT